MRRIRQVTAEDVGEVLGWLDVEATDAEIEAIVDQVNGFVDVVGTLEDREQLATRPRSRSERFDVRPHRPTPEEDPFNAWLTRCELTRPDATGPLTDVQVGIKDCIAVAGLELTWGSRAFEGFVPAGHATVVERLLDAGATVAGKTNLDELTFAPTGETSAFGATDNPVDPSRAAGGSSSGSAAAVAAGDVDLALGTDAGGSIRMPASYCGVVGFKPTFGRVPAQGSFRITHSMDHLGPLARDVETAARGYSVIADDTDPVSLDAPSEDLTVGVVSELLERADDDAVTSAVRDAADALEDTGITVETVSIPELAFSRPAWWGIAPVEFATIYATNDLRPSHRDGVSPDIAAAIRAMRGSASEYIGTRRKGLLALGAYLLQTHDGYHHVRAANCRAALVEGFEDTFETFDALLAPTTPTTAIEHGGFERGTTSPVNACTHPTNLTGHPSLSLPVGRDGNDLPIGVQVIGELGDDGTVLSVGRTLEDVA